MILELVAFSLLLAFCAFVFLRRLSLGSIPISTQALKFNKTAFGHKINWDKHVFYINGRKTLLVSAEFHYWRLPDQSRWRDILRLYKQIGFNAIRIYFHWGYHSPSEDNYHFDGNRDIEFLLRICEELNLLVMAAPGPYICAETQAGGLPFWLVSKRHVRIRHSLFSFFRLFDPEYSKYCRQWYSHICPILAKHQITNSTGGCVIAFQIENESFELFKGIPVGLADDMRLLAQAARDFGINVPLFTNDGWEEGSFVARDKKSSSVFGKMGFGLDLYGFDKYLVFCPTSSPLSAITLSASGKEALSWPEWCPSNVENAFGKTETTVRSFGGGAASSPIFIPELQGGWFNHYTVKHSYDDIYNYYGQNYTRTIFDTAISQGVTAMNFYMGYGGTNWGTLGDPDVYTSYDYSACIREYGHLSGRGRQLRLAISFARSFSTQLCKTNHQSDPLYFQSCSISDYIAGFRIQDDSHLPVEFTIFRNFNRERKISATITIQVNGETIHMISKLLFKKSFIGIANYTPSCGPKLIFSTLPIYFKTKIKEMQHEELWIIQCDNEINGEFCFEGTNVEISESDSLRPIKRMDGSCTIISFRETKGYARIGDRLHIIALTGDDLLTLSPCFKSPWKSPNDIEEEDYDCVFWGAYGVDLFDERLIVKTRQSVVLSGVNFTSTLKPFETSHGFVSKWDISVPPDNFEMTVPSLSLPLQLLRERTVVFDKMPWQDLPLARYGVPKLNPIDFCFTSGHSVYKINFNPYSAHRASKPCVLHINARHRFTVFLNGTFVASDLVYSLGVYRAGAKNGPDIGLFGGWRKFELPKILVESSNTLIILVESFGLNRQPFAINDVRNPRGILKATISNATMTRWQIAGVDVRTLKQPFNHTGLPDQNISLDPIRNNLKQSADQLVLFVTNPRWYDIEFTLPTNRGWEIPMRLELRGLATAYCFLNGTLIARYYGNGDSSQHSFLLSTGLFASTNEQADSKDKINNLKILSYSCRADASELKIQIRPWEIQNTDETGDGGMLGSGNVSSSGKGTPFKLFSFQVQGYSFRESPRFRLSVNEPSW